MQQELTSNNPIQALDLLRKCCSYPFMSRMRVELPVNVSLQYPIQRRCFLDFQRESFCAQLSSHSLFDTHLQKFQSRNLSIARKLPDSLICCISPTNSK